MLKKGRFRVIINVFLKKMEPFFSIELMIFDLEMNPK